MNINRRKALILFASTLLVTLLLLNVVSFAFPKPMPDSNSGRSTTTQIEDEISAATPLSGSTIVVDGYPDDWAGISPIVSDVKYDASSPYDIHDVYVTDDGTYLYLMMELDSMGSVGLFLDLDVDQNITTGYNTNLDPFGWYMNPHDTGFDFEISVDLAYPSVPAHLTQFFANGSAVYIKDVAVAAEIVIETCVLLSDIGEPAPPSINMDFQTYSIGPKDEAPDIGCVTYAPYAPSLVPEDLELYPREVIMLPPNPTGTQWHELHPNTTDFYEIASWEPGEVLSPCDYVEMEPLSPAGPIEPFDVDEVTIGIAVWDDIEYIEHWLYYECGYWTFKKDVWTDPVGSKWIEIKNEYGPVVPPRCWHLTSWYDDDGDGKLSWDDFIEMTPMYPYPGPTTFCYVDWVTVNLKLTEEPAPTPPVQYYLEFGGSLDDFQAMDYIHMPWTTWWYEILPVQGREWQLTNWVDAPMLSPSDQITLISKDPETHIPIPGTEAEYHVDKLTVAMNLTSEMMGKEHIVKFEGSLLQFKKYHWTDPRETQWHEVNPDYCRQWHLIDHFDIDGDFMLSPGDMVFMIDKETGWPEFFFVESLSTDIWVTQLIHDVAVVDVTPDKTIVEPGDNVTIYVTVANDGDLTETFNVYAYANTTTIGTLVVNDLLPGTQTILTFIWDTTGWTTGNYTISAAAVLPGDDDPGDNTFIDGTVYVGIHDVAVTDVTPSRTVVCQGDSMSINVTVENQGDSAETFNVTLYYNSNVINYTTVTNLPPGENTTITFTWNTTGVTKGNYTISAYAEPILGETDTEDNTFTDGWVSVAMVGDVNADGKVDLKDVFAVAIAYGSFPGHPKWNPNADINGDGKVDLKDYYATVLNYGKVDP